MNRWRDKRVEHYYKINLKEELEVMLHNIY